MNACRRWTRDARAAGLRHALAMFVFLVLVPGALLPDARARTEQAARESVLLISIDSLRADRLGCYGNRHDASPTLDRLAREGVRFANAVSSTSWTLPAHVTMLTGLALRHHQVITPRDRIRASEHLLAESFRAQGYETAGFYSGPFLHPVYGFDRGFDRYVSCESPAVQAATGRARLASSASDHTNPRIETAFKEWIAGRSQRPFFAFVHMWDVHYDYIPPPPYATMFDADYKGKLDGRDIMGAGFPLDASGRDVEHLQALYDGEVRYTDETIDHLLQALDRAKVLDHTLVVVTSDHGDEFLEHGGKGHLFTLYEELIHVPLILWSRSGLPRGKLVAPAVSLADVAPTILDLAGLPALPGTDGQTLRPLLAEDSPPDRQVSSTLYNAVSGELMMLSTREETRKVIYDLHASPRKQWRVYDLARDPGEQAPLYQIVMPLKKMAQDEQRAMRERVIERVRNQATLPPELTEKLKSLGYLK